MPIFSTFSFAVYALLSIDACMKKQVTLVSCLTDYQHTPECICVFIVLECNTTLTVSCDNRQKPLNKGTSQRFLKNRETVGSFKERERKEKIEGCDYRRMKWKCFHL